MVRVLAEQAAVPIDQLARFAGKSVAATVVMVKGLRGDGYVDLRQFLIRDQQWVWLTERGMRASGMDYPAREPAAVSLGHRRAVNEVRLRLTAQAPEARWVCERALLRERGQGVFVPDGLLVVGEEVHAIEVELSRKHVDERRERLSYFSERYDAVVYFCGPRAHGSMQWMRSRGRWPKLVVRKLPKEALR